MALRIAYARGECRDSDKKTYYKPIYDKKKL